MRRYLVLLVAFALVGVFFAPAASASATGRVRLQTTGVDWHPQQTPLGHTGVVEGGRGNLVRLPRGIAFKLKTPALTPGNAYTLWLVTINNPENCAAHPCSGMDIVTNAATRSQVRYADGLVAPPSGRGTFHGYLREGAVSGWLPDRTFDDSSTVSVHLVINDHGPALAEFMPNMIESYRGGCSDASPFPGFFPQTAKDDGLVGPNICRLYQTAVFEP